MNEKRCDGRKMCWDSDNITTPPRCHFYSWRRSQSSCWHDFDPAAQEQTDCFDLFDKFWISQSPYVLMQLSDCSTSVISAVTGQLIVNDLFLVVRFLLTSCNFTSTREVKTGYSVYFQNQQSLSLMRLKPIHFSEDMNLGSWINSFLFFVCVIL